ncbi:hypothetical protein TNCV_3213621 [Trichonephila clavipes]|nr:hypothetical protein TNCV_3213621 [Trichonephila clavipes]
MRRHLSVDNQWSPKITIQSSKVIPTFTKSCKTQDTPDYILDCMGIDKQDLCSSSMLVLTYLREIKLIDQCFSNFQYRQWSYLIKRSAAVQQRLRGRRVTRGIEVLRTTPHSTLDSRAVAKP